jgi:hypothetical protein
VSSLSSSGWKVNPSFVPNGPTSPVTLLFDEGHFTQLAGEPPVAWQTPWAQVTGLQLTQMGKKAALFATIAGVRYVWRNDKPGSLHELRSIVGAHDGVIKRQQRRLGAIVVAVVVLVASFAGGLTLGSNSHTVAPELTAARSVLLTKKDLGTDFIVSSRGVLSSIIPSASRVLTPTPITKPKAGSAWAKVVASYESCLGIGYNQDRMYGGAGQSPAYQVSAPIFSSIAFGGIEVGVTSQFYKTTTMVSKDTKSMQVANFGSCFVTSNVTTMNIYNSVPIPTSNIGTDWQPAVFSKTGWARGGYAPITVPGINGPLSLGIVEVTNGHFETTIAVLVADWKKAEGFVSNLASTALARMSPAGATAV